MQQSYRALRIIAETQTIRIILAPEPDELMLNELSIVCNSLNTDTSSGIKAVVLDFNPTATKLVTPPSQNTMDSFSASLESACTAVRIISQPVLAVIRATLSQPACQLIKDADFTLISEEAKLILSNKEDAQADSCTGVQAVRRGYITWSASANDMNKQMERILDSLRAKSAIALRYTKASVRLVNIDHETGLKALQQVNTLYLTHLMQTHDAQEGLQAFLQKRKPNWKNI